jgi:hypothetical protein
LCDKSIKAELAQVKESGGGGISLQLSVAMGGDLFPVDPKVYGFELPSHLSVWDACQKLIAEDAREQTVCVHRTKDLFRRAQRMAGVTLDDPVVTAAFERVLRHTLIRTVSLAAIARALVEAGLPVKLIGRGWPMQEFEGKARAAEFGSPAQMFDGVAVILHADPAAIVDPILLAGMAMGKAVVSIEHPHEAEDGGIAAMFEPGKQYVKSRAKDVVATLRALLQDSLRRNKIGEAGREQVLAKHTWERRWEKLR